jgi:hypothetical protein
MAIAALTLFGKPASAHEVSYAGLLLGSNEVPAAATTGSGSAFITFDLDLITMHVQVSFSGLLGNVTASHIHCCVAPGTNVAVATQLPTFSGFPLGGTSGTYDHTFDMSLSSSYNPAFISSHGGTVGTAFNSLVAGLDAGNAYLNIHTSSFPGGELRALLAPVPEPETYGMMLAGLALVGAVARKRNISA